MAPGDTSPRYEYLGAVTWDEGHRPGRLYRDRQDGDLLCVVPVELLPVGTSPEEAIRWFRQRMSIPGWTPSASRSPTRTTGIQASWSDLRTLPVPRGSLATCSSRQGRPPMAATLRHGPGLEQGQTRPADIDALLSERKG